MVFLRHLFFIFSFLAIVSINGVSTCHFADKDSGKCSPYTTQFLKVEKSRKSARVLRNQPIIEKKVRVIKEIKIRNGITLENLVARYIKREEGRYAYFQKKIHAHAVSVTMNDLNVSHETEREAKKQQQSIIPSLPDSGKEEPVKADGNTVQLEQYVSRVSVVEPEVSLPEKEEKKRPETKEYLEKIVPIVSEKKLAEEAKRPVDISRQDAPKTVDPALILPAEPKETLAVKPSEQKPNIKLSEKKDLAVYIVKKGESLLGIAKRFGVKVQRLIEINQLKPQQSPRVGQKIYLPLSQERADAIDIAFYIVKKGDTLSGIAKRFKVKLRDLKRYNKVRKKSIIHVGQGLVLPLPHKLLQLKRIEAKKKKERLRKKRERERLARLALKKREKKRFLKISKKLTRKLSVTATAYTSHRGQTDKTPFLAAWNNRIRPGMKIIAVSRDLIYKYGITNGKKVRISGLSGIYTVRDKMNKKWRRKIDIYMGTSRWRALRWGKRRVTLYY